MEKKLEERKNEEEMNTSLNAHKPGYSSRKCYKIPTKVFCLIT
jgi:hypothetical protein